MSKKALARVGRKNEKAIKNQDNNLRLAQSISLSNRPLRTEVAPDLSKTPRIAVNESGYINYVFEWTIFHADRDGVWSWHEPRQWTDIEYQDIIKNRLIAFENCTWQQVEAMTYNGKGGERKPWNKYQELDTICDEAQERWKNHGVMKQFDLLFRLRLGTHKRIWGVRVQHHFFMFWYERHHRICPIKN